MVGNSLAERNVNLIDLFVYHQGTVQCVEPKRVAGNISTLDLRVLNGIMEIQVAAYGYRAVTT